MASTLHSSQQRCTGPGRNYARRHAALATRNVEHMRNPCVRFACGMPRLAQDVASCKPRPWTQPLKATDDKLPGPSSDNPGDEDDELDKLLGIGRYRSTNGGLINNQSSSTGEGVADSDPAATSEVQDTLADVVQMEVRRVRAREELAADLEERKEQMRVIGEEMKAALAREYELDRLRTEMGANYAMSGALHELDDVEAEVQRIKQQLQADKADLEAWEAKTAEERSRGLFFRSLYDTGRQGGKPPAAGKEGGEAAPAASAAASADSSVPKPSTPSTSTTNDPKADPRRPLSAASRQVRSPLRLYVFSYLSAFLALLLVNDLATSSSPPHVVQDWLTGALSAALGLLAVGERQALGQAQDAMLEGIRRTAGSRRDRNLGRGSSSGGGGGGGGDGGMDP